MPNTYRNWRMTVVRMDKSTKKTAYGSKTAAEAAGDEQFSLGARDVQIENDVTGEKFFMDKFSEVEHEHFVQMIQHLKKGHKKTKPFNTEQDFVEFLFDNQGRHTQKEYELAAIGEMDRWHSDHHEEHKDFMMHMQSPYTHVN